MASEPEIHRVRVNKDVWQPLAKRLLVHADEETFPQRHLALLEGLVERTWQDELSYRQAEWLLDIRDDIELLTTYRGYSVRLLTKVCYEQRHLLIEDEEAWIIGIYEQGRSSLRRYEAGRLYSISKRLNEVD